MNTQYLRSLQALHMVRSIEARYGVASLEHLIRSAHAPRPTPAKLHKISDRGARKAFARRICVGRVLHGPSYYPASAGV